MTLHSHDYLAWIRHIGAWMHAESGSFHDLLSSAVQEPAAVLKADLDRLHHADGDSFDSRLATPMSWGHPRLIEALARHYGVAEDHLLITSGGSMAFVIAALALSAPGDHAVVEAPIYQPFLKVLDRHGVQVSYWPRKTPQFELDIDALQSLIQPNTRLIVLTNLHNPGGALLSDETLRQIAAIARPAGIFIVVDEVFHDLVPDSASARTAALLDEQIVSISSLAKAYGLGRIRVGWIAAAASPMAALRETHASFDNSLFSIAQVMASAVLENAPRYRQHGQQIVAENQEAIRAFAREMTVAGILEGDAPAYGCVYFPRVIGVEDTTALAQHLLDQHRVVVAPGHYFHAPGHLRISFGGEPSAVRAGLERLADALKVQEAYISGSSNR